MTVNFQELSVFGLERRTNNHCESYHSQFNRIVDGDHPNCWDFADYCNEMLEVKRHEYEKLEENPHEPIVRESRPAQQNRIAKLRREERQLINNTITPMEFIDKNIHAADGVIGDIIGDDDDSLDEDSEGVIEEDDDPIIEPNINQVQNDSCLSCEHISGEKFVLDCGQQPFCNDCSANILAVDNPTCPICNRNVSNRMQIRA